MREIAVWPIGTKYWRIPNFGLPSAERMLGLFLIVMVGLLTLAPVAYVLLQSFNVAQPGQGFRFGFLAWRELFSSSNTLNAIGYSLLLSIRIPIAITVAFVIAWLLARVQVPGHRIIEHTLWFGFFLPVLPVTMGWILLLDSNYGLINQALRHLPFVTGPVFSAYTIPSIIWVHLSLSSIPIMVILLTPALRQMDASLEQAAEMSGAGIPTSLWRVTLPLVAPALLTAFVAGFIRSLEVFEVEQVLGTPVGIFVYSTRIYDLINWEPPLFPQAMALSALFLGFLLIVALIYQHILRTFSGRATITGKGVRLQPRRRNAWSYVGSAVLFLYLTASILLPLIVLILGSFSRVFGFFFIEDAWTIRNWTKVFDNVAFVNAGINSTAIGLWVGVVGTLIYALIAWMLARTTVAGRGILSLLTWLPWAIPGLVAGTALLSLMLNTPGLSYLYGTMVPLVIAMIIAGMPLGVQMLRTSIEQVSKDLEESARMSGAKFATIFRRITLPLMAPMCVAVFLLVLMMTLRDISTVIMLAAPGTRTLSLLMFEFATASQMESAAVIGVVIALISLAMASVAFRLGLGLGSN